jgi:hypothetical protein
MNFFVDALNRAEQMITELRIERAEMLDVLKLLEKDIEWHENSPTLKLVRETIGKAEQS